MTNYLEAELQTLIQYDPIIFEFIQSGLNEGMWYWDLENPEHEWMSPKFWTTFGYDPAAMKHLSSEWQDIIFKEDLETTLVNFKKHCDDPTYPFDQIVRYRHKDNSTVWIWCRGLAIRNEDGKATRMLGVHVNVTNLKQTEQRLASLAKEYETVFHGTQNAMFLIRYTDDGLFRFVRTNREHQEKTKISLEQIQNKTPQELLGAELGHQVIMNYQRCIDQKERISYEEDLSLPGGRRVWLTTLTPIFEEDSILIVGSSTDITEQKLLEKELEYLANYDKLTSLPNRRYFINHLDRLIKKSKTTKSKFALLYVDLVGFKLINDSYGHFVGDQLLIEIGKRLLQMMNKKGIVARIGGG